MDLVVRVPLRWVPAVPLVLWHLARGRGREGLGGLLWRVQTGSFTKSDGSSGLAVTAPAFSRVFLGKGLLLSTLNSTIGTITT